MCIVPETLKQILDGSFRNRSWIMGVSFLPIASKETCTASATLQTKEICTQLHCKETCTEWITLQQSASISKRIKASDAKLLISTRCKNPGTMCMCTQTEEEDGHDHGGGGASAFQ